MFDGHYEEWRNRRIRVAETLLGTDFFAKKNILEVGCGHGHVGRYFAERYPSSSFTCLDGRAEHIDKLNEFISKERRENIKTIVCDCDEDMKELGDEHFDLLIHWGLLYHLRDPEKHLAQILKHADYVLLESELCDSSDVCCDPINEAGYDQAKNGTGCKPSQAFVEKCLEDNGFEFRIVNHRALNADIHVYDWKPQNTQRYSYTSGQRRFWICWKRELECKIADLEILDKEK